MSEDAFTLAMRAGVDDLVRGMAEARICRTAVVARDLFLKAMAESRAEQALGPEQGDLLADTLDAIDRLIERLGSVKRGLSPGKSIDRGAPQLGE
jgi:hypothetical protein